jgi:beta-lactam-binding protein with PASTA domain
LYQAQGWVLEHSLLMTSSKVVRLELHRLPIVPSNTRTNPHRFLLKCHDITNVHSVGTLENGMAADGKLDGKYEILRELEITEARKVLEVRHPDGRVVRLDWFNITDPKSRASFHRYRSVVRNSGSSLLLDAVARPGAYYSVWSPSNAQEAGAWLAAHPRDEAFRSALTELSVLLAEYGFAFSDARVLAVPDSREGSRDMRPVIADLSFAERSNDEIAALNSAVLPAVSGDSLSTPGRNRWSLGRGAAKPVSKPGVNLEPKPAPVINPRSTVEMRPAPFPGGWPMPALAGMGGATVVAMPKAIPRRLTIWGVLPGLLILAAAVYLGIGATQRFLEPPVVTVPDLVGKPVEQVGKLLADARLFPRIEYYSDQTKVRGIVLRQNPAGGVSLTEGRVVEITVNKPRPLIVPNIAGRSEQDARFSLKEIGLNVSRVVKIPIADTTSRGLVLGQNPPPDSEAVKGQGVTLLVGGDRPEVGKTFLPDLRGLTFEDAKFVLSKSGLTLVEVRQKDAKLPPNTVLEQTPAPYTSVALDGEATLVVSSVPDALTPVRPAPPVKRRPVITAPPAQQQPTTPTVTTPDVPTGSSPQQQVQNVPDLVIEQPVDPVPQETTPTPEQPVTVTSDQPVTVPTPADQPIQSTAESRTVDYSFTAPAENSTYKIFIKVIDDDGERFVVNETDVPKEFVLQSSSLVVRGAATIIFFVDGVETQRLQR